MRGMPGGRQNPSGSSFMSFLRKRSSQIVFGRWLEGRVDVSASLFVMRVGLRIYDVGNVPYALGQAAEIRLAGLYAIGGIIGNSRNRRLLRWRSATSTATPSATTRRLAGELLRRGPPEPPLARPAACSACRFTYQSGGPGHPAGSGAPPPRWAAAGMENKDRPAK